MKYYFCLALENKKVYYGKQLETLTNNFKQQKNNIVMLGIIQKAFKNKDIYIYIGITSNSKSIPSLPYYELL